MVGVVVWDTLPELHYPALEVECFESSLFPFQGGRAYYEGTCSRWIQALIFVLGLLKLIQKWVGKLELDCRHSLSCPTCLSAISPCASICLQIFSSRFYWACLQIQRHFVTGGNEHSEIVSSWAFKKQVLPNMLKFFSNHSVHRVQPAPSVKFRGFRGFSFHKVPPPSCGTEEDLGRPGEQ